MKPLDTYHDLCKEIDILEVRLNDLEREYMFLYHSLYNAEKKPIMRMGLVMDRMNLILEETTMYAQVYEWKEEARKEIEKRISTLENVDHKVVYLRDVKGMSLQEIAIEMGYSLIWIKKISARNKKEYTKSILSS